MSEFRFCESKTNVYLSVRKILHIDIRIYSIEISNNVYAIIINLLCNFSFSPFEEAADKKVAVSVRLYKQSFKS